MAIDTPNTDYEQMYARWKLPLALHGGTLAMREATTDWLPQEAKESDESYKARLERTVLVNYYNRTIYNLVGSAFSSNITVTGVPKELEYLEWNINGEGQSITELAAQLFEDSLIFGKSHCYVDFPEVVDQDLTYADYKELGLKPYVARINPLNVIGWRHDYANGFEQLQYVRIKEQRFEEDQDYEQIERNIVRIVTPEMIEVYSYSPTSENTGTGYELINLYENTLEEVPLLCSYANKEAPFRSRPTLEDLAWLNLCHYQSTSDQRNILHISRVPFLLGTGFSEDEVDTVEIAPNKMVLSTNDKANLKYVEHTGAAINSGQNDINKIEEQMAKVGAEILFSKSVARQTATSRKIDQAEALSIIQTSLRSIEQMLEKAYLLAAKWMDLPTDFKPSVAIGNDLTLAEDPNPVQSFIQLQQMLGMKGDVMLEELKRRGLIAPHIKLSDLMGEVAQGMQQQNTQEEPEEEQVEDNEEAAEDSQQNQNEPES